MRCRQTFLPFNSHWGRTPSSVSGLYVVWPSPALWPHHVPALALALFQHAEHTLTAGPLYCLLCLEGSVTTWLTPSLQLRSWLKCHLITEAFPDHPGIAQTPTIIHFTFLASLLLASLPCTCGYGYGQIPTTRELARWEVLFSQCYSSGPTAAHLTGAQSTSVKWSTWPLDGDEHSSFRYRPQRRECMSALADPLLCLSL